MENILTFRLRTLLLSLIVVGVNADEYMGYLGYWKVVKVTAYSPHDRIDGSYHKTKGDQWRWITADGKTDVREHPYGIAVPRRNQTPVLAYGTQVIIPKGFHYIDSRENRVFECDDTGGRISALTRRTGVVHFDLRFKTEAAALQWAKKGITSIKVFVIQGKAPVPIPIVQEVPIDENRYLFPEDPFNIPKD